MWRSRLNGWLCDAHDIKNRRNAGGCLQRQLATLNLSPLLELAASDELVVLVEVRPRKAASQGRKRCAACAPQETLKSQCE